MARVATAATSVPVVRSRPERRQSWRRGGHVRRKSLAEKLALLKSASATAVPVQVLLSARMDLRLATGSHPLCTNPHQKLELSTISSPLRHSTPRALAWVAMWQPSLCLRPHRPWRRCQGAGHQQVQQRTSGNPAVPCAGKAAATTVQRPTQASRSCLERFRPLGERNSPTEPPAALGCRLPRGRRCTAPALASPAPGFGSRRAAGTVSAAAAATSAPRAR
mmetsp:Transcript_72186/g.199080  ORF Transcript_72186/g.199080 Transcript_72186/m.199080 type:complete len:221 (+) Transcript_72186:526-1188(+)